MQARNRVLDKNSKTIAIAGTKNAHVPFQIVLTFPPPPDHYPPAATGFFVNATNQVSGAGRRGLRFSGSRSACLPTSEYHVATGGRRVEP